jgi:hypothetical protein
VPGLSQGSVAPFVLNPLRATVRSFVHRCHFFRPSGARKVCPFARLRRLRVTRPSYIPHHPATHRHSSEVLSPVASNHLRSPSQRAHVSLYLQPPIADIEDTPTGETGVSGLLPLF